LFEIFFDNKNSRALYLEIFNIITFYYIHWDLMRCTEISSYEVLDIS
jgi:hypothetical protein